MTEQRRNLYGRRSGPKLRDGQSRALREVLPRVAAWDGASPLDPAALFPGAGAMWLEVGFGAGEHLLAQARAHPLVGLIGCEHYLNGVARCLADIERDDPGNVRIHKGDARDLMDALPDAGVARAFLLYPDPWPKARHHKRRFVGEENLASFARIMADGGELRVASDIPEYIDWTREALADHAAFAPVERDPLVPWEGWPGTRYEAKALREGRVPQYVSWTRAAR